MENINGNWDARYTQIYQNVRGQTRGSTHQAGSDGGFTSELQNVMNEQSNINNRMSNTNSDVNVGSNNP